MSDIDELLENQLKDKEFAKAWEDTELEYQIKRMLIAARIEQKMTQKERLKVCAAMRMRRDTQSRKLVMKERTKNRKAR